MKCPKCGKLDTSVIDSRLTEDSRVVRRRRKCEKCGARFTTFERLEIANFIVIKKDGTRELYSRGKLERGIWNACTKRPVTEAQINKLTSKLEEIWSANKKEISSQRIGKDIMDGLKKIDKVSYIRFASVYRDFKDVDEFKTELKALLK